MKKLSVLKTLCKLVIVISFLALSNHSTSALATTPLSSLTPIGMGIDDIKFELGMMPMAVEVCNGYATHDAVARGWGVIYRGVYPDTSNKVFPDPGACWQCSRCRMVLITEYDPLITGYVGYYASYNPGYVISIYGATLWTNDVYFTNNSRVPYFSLRYTY